MCYLPPSRLPQKYYHIVPHNSGVCISWKKRYNHRYNQRYSHKYNQRHSQREVGCFVHLLLSTSSYVSCTFMVSNASENSQEFPPIPSRWSAYRMPLMIAELAIL